MNVESEIGHVTNDVLGAVADAVTANLTVFLKNELNMSDDQISRTTSIARSTIDSVGFCGVSQYVSLFKTLDKR